MINDTDNFDLIIAGCPVHIIRADGAAWTKKNIAHCDSFAQTITIDNRIHGIRFWQVLWHEIFHMMVFSFDLSVPDELEENLVSTLAVATIAMLRDNPELSKEMMK